MSAAHEHHHPSADAHPQGADEHPHEAEEETLAPDEQPTPLWLPVVGAVLFFVAFIIIAAF